MSMQLPICSMPQVHPYSLSCGFSSAGRERAGGGAPGVEHTNFLKHTAKCCQTTLLIKCHFFPSFLYLSYLFVNSCVNSSILCTFHVPINHCSLYQKCSSGPGRKGPCLHIASILVEEGGGRGQAVNKHTNK